MVRQPYHLHRHLLAAAELVAPPASNDRDASSSRSYAGDAHFNSNFMVVLGGLACAVIGALGLNLLIRCMMRCVQRNTIDHHNTERATARTGLSEVALHRIPVVLYKSGLEIPASECPVCLGEFAEEEKTTVINTPVRDSSGKRPSFRDTDGKRPESG
ncbi:RING-type E3 ubiquitin transferase [Sarracenia purpurea var. burkii]